MGELQVSFREDWAKAIEPLSHLAACLDSAGRCLESTGTTTACEEFRSWHALRGPWGHFTLEDMQVEIVRRWARSSAPFDSVGAR